MSTKSKAINTVPAIDIGPGTPVLALGADGNLGQGMMGEAFGQASKEVIVPAATKAWYRIADVNKCGVGIIGIREYWNTSRPAPVLLGVAVDAFGDSSASTVIDAKVLAGHSDRITKVRLVIDQFNTEWAGHIDMLIDTPAEYGSRSTKVCVSGLGMRVSDLSEAPSVETANSVREISLSNSGG